MSYSDWLGMRRKQWPTVFLAGRGWMSFLALILPHSILSKRGSTG